LYSEQELKAKAEEWHKSAATDPMKKERIQVIEALLKPIEYKSAETKEQVIKGFASSGLSMEFILDYAESMKKLQGSHVNHYR
jgi:hypothetical protein